MSDTSFPGRTDSQFNKTILRRLYMSRMVSQRFPPLRKSMS